VNIERVANAIAQSPRKSTHRLAQQVNITHTSVRRILKNDLKLYPYKVQLLHQLLPADSVHRVTFSEWFVNKCREENDFVQYLITSDEAHFHLSGYVNKQNFRFWGKENPQVLHETPLHSIKVTVLSELPLCYNNGASTAYAISTAPSLKISEL
jgi:hypothetical protein